MGIRTGVTIAAKEEITDKEGLMLTLASTNGDANNGYLCSVGITTPEHRPILEKAAMPSTIDLHASVSWYGDGGLTAVVGLSRDHAEQLRNRLTAILEGEARDWI